MSDDEIKPNRFRQQHHTVPGVGGPAIIRSAAQVVDVEGRVGFPYVTRDVISVLESRKTIEGAQVEAARKFEADFGRASLTGYQAPDLSRQMGGGGNSGGEPERVLMARDRTYRALRALDKKELGMSAVVWDVFGMGTSLTEYSVSKTGTDRMRISRLLVGACDVLVGHYGL